MGAIVYVVFGSCKDINIGPTALISLMTHKYVQDKSADFAVLLAFLSGCLQLVMACLHLGTCLCPSTIFILSHFNHQRVLSIYT